MRGADQLQPRHVEQPEGIPPPDVMITVAEYLLLQLHRLEVTALHTIGGMETSPLVTATHTLNILEAIFWDHLQEALWASQNSSKCQGFGAIFCPELLLAGVFQGIVSSSYERIPLLFVVRRSLRVETKELCGLPLSVQEKGRKELRQLVKKFSAAYFLLDDRKTAAARIDRAIDTSLELLQPVVIELPDEVAQSFIPPHTHKRPVFNYEDHDIIKSCWHTILSRLEQAQAPLFIIGNECWPSHWHHTLFQLAAEFQAKIIASSELWGHLGADQPEGFLGYLPLHTLDIEGSFDSLFIFGVPSDCPWLETTTTHHDLTYSGDEELFCLNSSGLSFGDGREYISAPSLQEFFCHAPCIAETDPPYKKTSRYESRPIWYSLVCMLQDPSSPLFVHRDESLLSEILQLPPFAKIFIQPEGADDAWGTVSATCWSKIDPSHTIFVAGNTQFLTRAFGNLHYLIPNNLIFLLHDSENTIKEVSSLLAASILTVEDDIDEWCSLSKNPSHRPCIIWLD